MIVANKNYPTNQETKLLLQFLVGKKKLDKKLSYRKKAYIIKAHVPILIADIIFLLIKL